MPEAGLEFPELELIDSLIYRLDSLINESDSAPLVIAAAGQAKRAVYRILNNPVLDRKPKTAEAVLLDDAKLVLQCSKTDLVRQSTLEVVVQASKNGRGENMAVINGRVDGIKRVRGGYHVEIEVVDRRMRRITPGQKIRECLRRNDVSGWNRWCQDIRDEIELTGIDLKNSDLSGYDFCGADLSGSDLSGANLTGAVLAGADLRHCNLANVTVTGADFFHAFMNSSQEPLLGQSGMPEVESVIFGN
ncbi:MAG: pentapeptide repeat-containing protein [Planctomycetota bacterium]|jgi:hypothetical protein|nr:pentapeptide repeat-containing protein [Planctomycetota bacterium]